MRLGTIAPRRWLTRRRLAEVSGSTWLHVAVCVLLLGLSILQRPGRTTFDTKFDLTADPAELLSRSLHLWNPQASFGDLQNQAYGYLFPQGSFFLLAERLAVSDWWAQRIWTALLLLVAYEGCRRLCRALGLDGNGYVAILGGLAFATAPRLLGLAGVLSAEVLPTAVLPWVVLPLVRGLDGTMTARRAGLLSGFAVLFMGGVNAVENLAALPIAVFLVASGLRRAHGRRLAAWWAGATTLACLWWFIPLLVLGRYSPPFLNYIETSAATTRPLGWANSLRGADHWLAYIFVGGVSWWPGAYDLVTSPHLIVLTGAVAALGYFGLFHPRMPHRLPLALSLLTGLILLTIAHAGAFASPLDDSMRAALDGALAPLRNVHKVDPLVRLPLAVGLAHAMCLLVAFAARRLPRTRLASHERLLRGTAFTIVLAIVAASAQPLFTDRMRKTGWVEVPDAWYETAAYLDEAAAGTTLVLPGSGFGQQWWGWTIDEPLQGVGQSPWATRSQVPLIPGPSIRFLDSLESRIESGAGSPAFAGTLARAGISHVVVRRDIDVFAADVPAPARVDDAISHTPGLLRVESFGRSGFGDQPMIEIYAVEGFDGVVDAPWVSSFDRLYGGPEDIISSLEAGVLDADRPLFIGPGTPRIVGDGYLRQERQFGRLHDSLSQVMTEDERYRTVRAEHDYAGVPGVQRVSADYEGIDNVLASSSSAYVDTLGAIRPELGPAAAVDLDPSTYWRSAPYEEPTGQWLEVVFDEPVSPEGVDLLVGVDELSGVPVRRVRVDAGDQSKEYTVDPETGTVNVQLDGRPVERLRVTVLDVAGTPSAGVVAIREITVDGVEVSRSLRIPEAGAGSATSFVFRSAAPRRACTVTALGPQCDVEQARSGTEERGMSRTFTVEESGTWKLRGDVVALATPETAALLLPVDDRLRATSSSVFDDDPSVAGSFAVDGDPDTPWLAALGDDTPLLKIRWAERKTVSRLTLETSPIPGRTPTRAIIRSRGERREVELGGDAFGYFDPLRTRGLKVRLVADPPVGEQRLPVEVGELNLSGVSSLKYRPDPETRTGALCGFGPNVAVDGVLHPTKVNGTLADVLRGAPLSFRLCDGSLDLAAGEHVVRVASTSQFSAVQMVIEAPTGAEPEIGSRELSVTNWASTRRVVEVGDGPEAVLRVAENVNDGWRATLGSRVLEPTVVDGWQQGFVIPAGESGTVVLEYAPDGPYRLALLIGLLAALVLTGAVLFDRWRPGAVATVSASSRHSSEVRTATLPATMRWLLVLSAFATGAGYVLGGPMLAAGLLVGIATGRFRDGIRPLAGATLVLASSVVAAAGSSTATGVAPAAADLLGGLGIGVLAATLLGRRAKRSVTS